MSDRFYGDLLTEYSIPLYSLYVGKSICILIFGLKYIFFILPELNVNNERELGMCHIHGRNMHSFTPKNKSIQAVVECLLSFNVQQPKITKLFFTFTFYIYFDIVKSPQKTFLYSSNCPLESP